jgi:hypothetical protein
MEAPVPVKKPWKPRNGGRKKGIPNRCNAAVKFAFAAFMDLNLPKVQALWDEVAATDPKGAIQLLLDVSERLVPRLARTEITGENGAPVVVFRIEDGA